MDENALVSQPCVGMIDGVAASRCEWLARLSLASSNDEASRLARRISALRSTRISCDARTPARRSAAPGGRPASGRRCRRPGPAGSIGSRLASTRMRASRWLMRVRVSDRVERRPCSSPISWASRAFSCLQPGGARAGPPCGPWWHSPTSNAAARPRATPPTAILMHAVGDLDDPRGLRAVRYENDGPRGVSPCALTGQPQAANCPTVFGCPTEQSEPDRVPREVTRHTDQPTQKVAQAPASSSGSDPMISP